MASGLGRWTGLGRLTKRAEFLRVAGSGRKWVTPGLILQALRREPEKPAQTQSQNSAEPQAASGDRQEKRDVPASNSIRVGFTASRKVGSAVERNRAKRRLRAAAAAVLPEHGEPGSDYVVIARKGTLTRPFPELLSDLETALQRLKGRKSR